MRWPSWAAWAKEATSRPISSSRQVDTRLLAILVDRWRASTVVRESVGGHRPAGEIRGPDKGFAKIPWLLPPPSEPPAGTCRQLPLPLPLSSLDLNQILTRSR